MRKLLPIVMLMASAYPMHALADEVTCESKSSKKVECDMDTRGEVRMVRQLSNAACIEGETWGMSKHTVWVDKGCRAVFESRLDGRDGRDDGHRHDRRDDRNDRRDDRDDRRDDRDDRRDDRDDRRDDRRDAPHGVVSRISLLNAKCPGGLEVHADEGGPVYINGQEAQFKPTNANYYEATSRGVIVSVSRNTDGSQSVSYTGPGRANGICQVTSE